MCSGKFWIQICRLSLLLTLLISLSSWGFYAHKLINQKAIHSLPVELAILFKSHQDYLIEHATDPDKRCYIDTLESPRHFIDVDDLHEEVDSIPIHWSAAAAKFSELRLRAVGIIPWQIDRTYRNLRDALFDGDLRRILRYAADLGHYLGDAHVPLHTTKNYNGQYTNQIGIHAFWETRLPERFAPSYNFWIGRASYVHSPLDEAWNIIKESHALIDSVLHLEKTLHREFPADRKYAYVLRNGTIQKNYSEAYTKAYHERLNGMVERRMRASIRRTANFWYSAWVDAGQPDLSKLVKVKLTVDTLATPQPNQKALGRPEWH